MNVDLHTGIKALKLHRSIVLCILRDASVLTIICVLYELEFHTLEIIIENIIKCLKHSHLLPE